MLLTYAFKRMKMKLEWRFVASTYFLAGAIFLGVSLGTMFLINRQSSVFKQRLMSMIPAVVLVLVLFNALIPTSFRVQMAVAMAIFLLYVTYDTQNVLDSYNEGTEDVVLHGLQFYLDFMYIFVRLIWIKLMRRSSAGSMRGAGGKRVKY
jgi:FtsH-binding integral membrane protein